MPGVYPRTHGETDMVMATLFGWYGLSPHTRGNHVSVRRASSEYRSIPAHTGKPGFLGTLNASSRVYPRTHGETWHLHCFRFFVLGLSPHTRGNHSVCVFALPFHGSIPAHTGKPSCASVGPVLPEVYPRTHGETYFWRDYCRIYYGLSPHTRGNRPAGAGQSAQPRSIPAHTGKPCAQAAFVRSSGVYPRTHGETVGVTLSTAADAGLSPHTRGNQFRPDPVVPLFGSIPAHTGKPRWRFF